MKLLLNGNIIISRAPHIEFGEFENEAKWGLFDKADKDTRKVYYYMLDPGKFYYVEGEGYVGLDYKVEEVAELPEDYEEGKYFFEDGQFVLNPEWEPPLPSAEERIAELERQLAELNGDAVWDEMAVAIEEGVNQV